MPEIGECIEALHRVPGAVPRVSKGLGVLPFYQRTVGVGLSHTARPPGVRGTGVLA